MSNLTKIMSMVSESGAPTPPMPTPATDARSELGCGPEPDLTAVDQTLLPIQEDLNEAAENGMYPTPPVNTPAFSPAPSVIVRQLQRNRGMSAIGDRLAKLSMEDRSAMNTTHDDSSNRSVRSVTFSNDGEDDLIEERVPRYKLLDPSGNIPIALGSPALNPRADEYHNFLGAGNSAKDAIDVKKGDGVVASGVKEHSTWAEEVNDYLERAIKRLEQLADDETKTGEREGKSAQDIYIFHLNKALGSKDRKFPVNMEKTQVKKK